MKTICKDIKQVIYESRKPFRKDNLSDGSTLISNKMESIFNRMTPPDDFFLHRPGYFFNDNIGSGINIDESVSIRTYIRAAYLDYISTKYNAIVRHSDTLIDASLEDRIENDTVKIGIIYADDHSINDTRISLDSETDVHRIINTTIFESNRYFGNKIKYIDMSEFVSQINSSYGKALGILKGVLESDEYSPIYITGAIETSFIQEEIAFDTLTYDKVILCRMDASFIDTEMYDGIRLELSNRICEEINSKLPDEFAILTEFDERIITISVNYMESISESNTNIEAWANLLYGNSIYLESR